MKLHEYTGSQSVIVIN